MKSSLCEEHAEVLESRTENEASFSMRFDKYVPILGWPKQEGEQKGAKWTVAHPKIQLGVYFTSTKVADLKKICIFICRAAFQMHLKRR